MAIPTKDEVQAAMNTYIASLEQPLRALNKKVRSEIEKTCVFLTEVIDSGKS